MNDDSAENKRAVPFLLNTNTTSDVIMLTNLVPVPRHVFGPKTQYHLNKRL